MRCCGVMGIGDLVLFFKFLNRKNARNHFRFLEIERPHERGGLYELFYIRKHCKHKDNWFERKTK